MASFRKLNSGWKVTVSKRDPAGNLHQTSKSGFKTKNDARVYAAKIEAKKYPPTSIDRIIFIYCNIQKHIPPAKKLDVLTKK